MLTRAGAVIDPVTGAYTWASQQTGGHTGEYTQATGGDRSTQLLNPNTAPPGYHWDRDGNLVKDTPRGDNRDRDSTPPTDLS